MSLVAQSDLCFSSIYWCMCVYVSSFTLSNLKEKKKCMQGFVFSVGLIFKKCDLSLSHIRHERTETSAPLPYCYTLPTVLRCVRCCPVG